MAYDGLGVSRDWHFDVQLLEEAKVGRSAEKFFLVAHDGSGRLEILELGLEAMDAACKHACTKKDKGGAKIFFEGHTGSSERHEICYGKLDALVGQEAPDKCESRVAVFTCDEATGILRRTERPDGTQCC